MKNEEKLRRKKESQKEQEDKLVILNILNTRQ